ncbi:MAG: glycosyltransferase [Paludibacteraceae bacterium]|nr:glycosyltransferase [Paludibacteraceae bacterium]
MDFSLIIPVYNRPDEVDELLQSLTRQTDKDFEVLVLEDKSEHLCENVCQKYTDRLRLHYYYRPGTGRSERRNLGVEYASGDYYIFFDSDCVIPQDYIASLRQVLTENYVDCYGGPDAAADDFSDIQKAVNYSMTSIMTTGGIRGAMKQKSKFMPRSFNMGFSRHCYEAVGGFRNMICEDSDLSIRIKEAKISTTLIPQAYVYHKRRMDLRRFYKQVNTFGKGRVLLSRLHPGSLHIVHLFPTFFFIGHLILLVLAFWSAWFLLPIAVYITGIFVEAYLKNASVRVAALAIATTYIQLSGYGIGFLDECFTQKTSRTAQEELYGKDSAKIS